MRLFLKSIYNVVKQWTQGLIETRVFSLKPVNVAGDNHVDVCGERIKILSSVRRQFPFCSGAQALIPLQMACLCGPSDPQGCRTDSLSLQSRKWLCLRSQHCCTSTLHLLLNYIAYIIIIDHKLFSFLSRTSDIILHCLFKVSHSHTCSRRGCVHVCLWSFNN